MSETDIKRIDISLLLILRELARERRTTVVANRLGLSQSAVSHALARLRDVLKDPLFVRRSNGLEPTTRCLEYLPKVESLIGLARELVEGNASFDPATTTRTFTLAGHDMVLAKIMTPLIAHVRCEAPTARIGFRAAAGVRALEHLERREADIAVGTYGKLPNSLIAERLFKESFKVIARKKHPALRGRLDLKRYLALDHLLVSFEAGYVGRIDHALRRLGLSRNVVASVPLFLEAFAAVSHTDLIATVPECLARAHAADFGLLVRNCPVKVESFDVVAVHNSAAADDVGLVWLRGVIRDLFD
jgi:DNA-binding transcriptional LysR family regulator